MGSRVVSHNRAAATRVDGRDDVVTNVQYRRCTTCVVEVEARHGVGAVGDLDRTTWARKSPGVADLTTGLGIERGGVEDDPFVADPKNLGRNVGVGVSTNKVRETVRFDESNKGRHIGGDTFRFLIGTRSFALFGHCHSKAVVVDRAAALLDDLLGEFEWEAKGVVQFEGNGTG